MSNTIYERRKEVAKEVATKKAHTTGEASFPFEYRRSQVFVTVRKNGNNSTTPVKNKGK